MLLSTEYINVFKIGALLSTEYINVFKIGALLSTEYINVFKIGALLSTPISVNTFFISINPRAHEQLVTWVVR